MTKREILQQLGIEKTPNIENLVEYISPIDESNEAKPAVFLFGATGFTVKQSFGQQLIDDLEAKGYTVVCIPGPAAILPNEKKGLIKLPVRLHGHTSFNPVNWLQAYYKGTGKGGVEKNVGIASTILKALNEKGKLNKEKEILVEGWSRGGTAAQRFTHAIPKELEKEITINLRLIDPVMGGIHDAEHESDINTLISNHVVKAHIMYAASDQLPIFEPHYFRSEVTKRYLPTTHDGMALPFYREETIEVVELNELYRAEDFELGDGEDGHLSEEQQTRKLELEEKFKEKLIKFLLNQADTLSHLKVTLENGTELNKKRAEHKLDELGCIGRLPLYKEAAEYLQMDESVDEEIKKTLAQLAKDSEALWNKIKERGFKKVYNPAFLTALAKYSTPEMTKTVGGKLKHIIKSKFSKKAPLETKHVTVPPPDATHTTYSLYADPAKRDDFHNALDALDKTGRYDHLNIVKNNVKEPCSNTRTLTADITEYQIAINKEETELVTYKVPVNVYEVTQGSTKLFAIVADLAERCGQKTVRIDELPVDDNIRSNAWVALKLKNITTIPPMAPLGKIDEERLNAAAHAANTTTPTLSLNDV